MDKDILYELRQLFIDEWISKEDLLDSVQRKILSWEDYLWIMGVSDSKPERCKIIVEN